MALHVEKRGTTRFEIRCPVTVRVRAPGQSREARELGRGMLCDIGERGARFHFSRPLEVKKRICLDVHIQAESDNPMTTLRFWGVVERAQDSLPFEVAVRFVSRGLFLRRNFKRLNKVSQTARRNESGEWIN
jgi:hypothetical protein